MKNCFFKNKENLLILFCGLVIFTSLNIMMLNYHYEAWINPKVGFWSAFSKRFCISGFDPYTYIIISEWRPLYELSRHPLLSIFVWPLSEFNQLLKSECNTNCAIFIVAILWTLLSTTSWMLLYRILRNIISLNFAESLLLCMFYFSFGYVMLATFVPDHMIVSMTILLLALWVTEKRYNDSEKMPLRESLFIYFIGTGVTLTNGIKLWLLDLIALFDASEGLRKNMYLMLKRSAFYVLPTLLILGAYMWQMETTQREESTRSVAMTQRRIKADSIFAQKVESDKKKLVEQNNKKVLDNKLFTWTDTSIERWPLLYENILGEGLILHEDYLLKDANGSRPIFVLYNTKCIYILEILIVVLALVGLWYGRRRRILWAAMSIFIFDMIIHLGFRFAAADVYIMTAHWAFVIPISIAFTIKKSRGNFMWHSTLLLIVLALTSFMWFHNLSLIYSYIV